VIASIQPAEWIRFIDQEYLSGFIRDGGSAIKFAVPLADTLRSGLLDGLGDIGQHAGYLVVRINAAETKVHMMDEIFFRAAQQLPWRILCRKVIARLAAESGYRSVVDSADSDDAGDEGSFSHRLARANQVDRGLLVLELKTAIWNKVFKMPSLSKDFRVAMTHLCMAEFSGGQEGATTSKVLTDWLKGYNRMVSAVKPYQIFRRIDRTTARYHFESMLHWVRMAAYPGIVLLLDAQRVMLATNPHDEGPFYSKAAVIDSYEVLREFIDTSDRLQGCFIVVVPDMAFLEDHGRGISAYEALKHRIFDEIRDKNLVNPMASLARISATPQESLPLWKQPE
jgi:hypothetical protein